MRGLITVGVDVKVTRIWIAATVAFVALTTACLGSGDPEGSPTLKPAPTIQRDEETGERITPAPTPVELTGVELGAPRSGPEINGFDVLNYTHFIREDFGTYFLGEVRNNRDADAVAPPVTITLRNDDGEIIGRSADGLRPYGIVKAGETTYFKMQLDAREWASEEFEIAFEPAGPEHREAEYTSFDFSNVSITDEIPPGLLVQGHIVNTGDRTARAIRLTFVGLDGDGNVISGYGTHGPEVMAPGERAEFVIRALDAWVMPHSYEIIAHATPD